MLPPSAELKLLKFNQLRVNRRTESAAKEGDGPGVGEELSKLTLYQKRLQGMTEEMVRRMQQGPVPEPAPEGEDAP